MADRSDAWRLVFDLRTVAKVSNMDGHSGKPAFDVGSFGCLPFGHSAQNLRHYVTLEARSKPDGVYHSIARIWISTIYGQDAVVRLGVLRKVLHVNRHTHLFRSSQAITR